MTFAPGKKHHGMYALWDRDLDLDLARLRAEYNTDLLVSLIEEHEFASLQIADLRERVTQYDMEMLWYPIPDGSVPTSIEELAETVRRIVDALRRGQTVVIHCMGGLGRTGLVAAACLLATTSLTPRQAIEIVRRARENTINAYGQEEYIARFRRFLDDRALVQMEK
jgi:protein-tyrosine phosphatase